MEYKATEQPFPTRPNCLFRFFTHLTTGTSSLMEYISTEAVSIANPRANFDVTDSTESA